MSQKDNQLPELEKQLYVKLKSLKATNNLLVAFSGGIDSKVLLHALANLKQQQLIKNIAAIHVNHGLQTAAEQWQKQCEKDCAEYQIPFYTVSLNLSLHHQSNIEAIAREERYKVFQQYLHKEQFLVTAHHLDDQAETLLFRLIRGCGLHGVSAMSETRTLSKEAGNQLIRPMLDLSKQAIEAYAKKNQLTWIEDPSNQDVNFSRNYLRHKVMPVIRQQWPSVTKTFSRFSQIAKQQSQLLDEIAQEDFISTSKVLPNHCVYTLDIEKLFFLSSARQKNLLHYWIKKNQKKSSANNEINEIVNQLSAALDGASIQVNVGDGIIRSYQKNLWFIQSHQPANHFEICVWDDIQHMIKLDNDIILQTKITNQIGLRKPLPNEKVILKPRNGGETCLPDYRNKSTSLKKIYQELGVPPWQREWLPIIYYNEEIVAVPGVFICKDYLTEEGKEALQIIYDFE